MGPVSVIIPVYNAEKYIDSILSDICNQTYQNLEIIIINDGSTDRSEDIIQKYLDDPRVIYRYQNNSGVSAARNLGLSLATGDYIRFVDADDSVNADSVEQMLGPFASCDDLDLVLGNFTFDGMYFVEDQADNQMVDMNTFVGMFCRSPRSFYYGVPWNKLYRNNIIQRGNIRFDESLKCCEDFIFNLEYYSHCRNFYFLHTDQGIYHYRDAADSLTKRASESADEMFPYINRRRKEAIMRFASDTGIKFAEYCWEGSELYGVISTIAKIGQKPKGLRNKYLEFRNKINAEGMPEYIAFMTEGDNNRFVWKLLDYSVKHHNYLPAFLFFAVKGLVAYTSSNLIPDDLKDRIKKRIFQRD